MTKMTAAQRRAQRKKEAPPADGLTVGWMVTLLTTLFCEIGAIATRAYAHYFDPEAKLLLMLSGLFLFAAAIIGIFLLVITPVVLYRKRSHPPRGIVVFAVVVGLSPWVGMILQAQE